MVVILVSTDLLLGKNPVGSLLKAVALRFRQGRDLLGQSLQRSAPRRGAFHGKARHSLPEAEVRMLPHVEHPAPARRCEGQTHQAGRRAWRRPAMALARILPLITLLLLGVACTPAPIDEIVRPSEIPGRMPDPLLPSRLSGGYAEALRDAHRFGPHRQAQLRYALLEHIRQT